MDKVKIAELFSQFESASLVLDGVEFWSARDLQNILGYTKWSNFEQVILKAKESCISVGNNELDHFANVGKMVDLGSGSKREIVDLALTRYACYLIAQMEIQVNLR